MSTMRQVKITTGTEGNADEPETWVEFVLETEQVTRTLHVGLVLWAQEYGKGISHKDMVGEGAIRWWIAATGVSPRQFDRAYEKAASEDPGYMARQAYTESCRAKARE